MSAADQPESPQEESEPGDEGQPLPGWIKRKPHPLAKCEKCGTREVSCLPTFALGHGIALRPIADDIYCRRCGHIGPPDW